MLLYIPPHRKRHDNLATTGIHIVNLVGHIGMLRPPLEPVPQHDFLILIVGDELVSTFFTDHVAQAQLGGGDKKHTGYKHPR
ncbi:hypothetical protein D3C86_1565440 [compost metagenome]